MVVLGTGGAGTRFIKRDYPIEEGLELGTTKLKDNWILRAEEQDQTTQDDKLLIDY